MPEDSFTETESSFQCSDRPTVNVIISMIAFDLFNCCGTHFFKEKQYHIHACYIIGFIMISWIFT